MERTRKNVIELILVIGAIIFALAAMVGFGYGYGQNQTDGNATGFNQTELDAWYNTLPDPEPGPIVDSHLSNVSEPFNTK